MSGFTPGPWRIQESATSVTVRSADDETLFHDLKSIPRVLEDARLISAAPELLAALIDLIGWVPGPSKFHTDEPLKAVERARAAIAKARGEL